MIVTDWLTEFYGMVEQGRDRAAGDLLFERVDDAFLDGRFQEINELLPTIKLELLNPTLLVGWLCITFAAKPHLPSRDALVLRVEQRLRDLGEPEVRITGLLQGLR